MRYWVRDRLVAADEAHVAVLDHGFTVGDGVFETLKVTDGVPFALTRHLARLARSAAVLDLPEPDEQVVREAVAATLAANAADVGPLGRLRITYASGAGALGSERAAEPPTLVVVVAPGVPWPATAAVVTVPWTRNERGALAGVKSTSYAENVIALARARAAGASEGLLANTRGELCEGTGSNVVVVVDGQLLTPPLTSGCLAGITRELVLEWCGGREVDLPHDVLLSAAEIALTSSTRDVHPVHRVDTRELPAPGPVIAQAAAVFAERAADQPDP